MLYNELEQGDILSGVRWWLALLAYTDILLCSIWAMRRIRQTPELYYNTFITNHRLSAENAAQVAQAGRGRWKIENENNNVLKTKGYHLEHNFGHGKQYLATTMLSLNLLAFLFHTVLEWSDASYALLRQVLVRRQTFFEDMRALTRYMVFESWYHLMDFMIQGLKLESRLAPKLGAKLNTS